MDIILQLKFSVKLIMDDVLVDNFKLICSLIKLLCSMERYKHVPTNRCIFTAYLLI